MDKALFHSDGELTELLRQGSESAFQEIYNRYWGVLYMHAYKMLREEEPSMDIIQDVFTELWSKKKDLEIHHSIKAYLYTTVRYRTLDALRRDSQHDKFLSSMVRFAQEGYNTTEEDVNLREFIKRIEVEVAQLPPRMREIFELSRFEGKSNKSIAQQLAITDHTVKKTLNRALHVLRSKLTLFFIIILSYKSIDYKKIIFFKKNDVYLSPSYST